ncbi:MAG TPA: Hsp70 family protein [Candidatus Limnocylindria bacterium]|nr:Hsp70 family protein [Candidatus Limnocylindria bacterium]
MRFGLDFGTSNTTLAVEDGGTVRVLEIDPLAGATMPSVLYVRRDGSALVGRPATLAFLADNASRGPVKRELRLLGVRLASSDNKAQAKVEAHILADPSSPGRFFQSLKTFLGDPLLRPTNVFGDAKGLSDLIATILEHVRTRARDLTGTAPETVTLGRPVEFIGGPEAEERATARLAEAARLAGFRDVRSELEPVAAAWAANVADGTALVFDFGGGTLDLCVTRRERGAIRVLATAGADIGGDRMTQLLIDETVAPRLGAGVEWGPKRLILPRFVTNAIGDWRALSALNEKWLLDALDELVRAGAPRRELAALRSAIELQLGYEIFATVDDAKRTLSDASTAFVVFHRGSVDVDERVTRRRFEGLISPLMERIAALCASVLDRAGADPASVVEVVTTGGSSAIPAARALLARTFPAARVREADPYRSVAAGLALR